MRRAGSALAARDAGALQQRLQRKLFDGLRPPSTLLLEGNSCPSVRSITCLSPSTVGIACGTSPFAGFDTLAGLE
jgi:hypothetical protein